MSTAIPIFQLNALTEATAKPAAYSFLGPDSARSPLPIDRPFRSDYYKIGLCLRGTARLKINLETYDLGPDSLMVLPPFVVKQWLNFSADFEAFSFFFTPEFAAAGNGLNPDAFTFFARAARPVLALPPAPAATLRALLLTIGQKCAAPHVYRDEILRSLLHILLHETAPIYDQQQPASQPVLTRSQLITSDFKALLNAHYGTERSLAFYASKLCISTKHLAETVRATTGKRASEWLGEAVLLEAQVLLQNPALTVGQIADNLHFADQSAFGRFFRKSTGVSPAAYRQRNA